MSGTQSADEARQLIGCTSDALIRARTLLLQPAPQNLDIAASSLGVAIAQLTDLQSLLTVSPSGDLLVAAVGLGKELDLISRLLEHAASYHANLFQCMIEAADLPTQQAAYMESTRCMSLEA